MSELKLGGVRWTKVSVKQDKTTPIQCQHYFFRMTGISVRLTGSEEKNVPIGAFLRFRPLVTGRLRRRTVSRFDCAVSVGRAMTGIRKNR